MLHMCVKLHTVSQRSFCVQYEKILSHEIFYTHAVTDVTDNYQVWSLSISDFRFAELDLVPALVPLQSATLVIMVSNLF